MKYVFSTARLKRYRFPTHTNYLVMDRSDADGSEVFIVELTPGESPPPHQHDDMEQIFYILSGGGLLKVGADGEAYPLVPGDVVRIPLATPHTVQCVGDALLRYLAVDCFPTGRPAAEPTWDAHIKGVCEQLGWDFEQIVGE